MFRSISLVVHESGNKRARTIVRTWQKWCVRRNNIACVATIVRAWQSAREWIRKNAVDCTSQADDSGVHQRLPITWAGDLSQRTGSKFWMVGSLAGCGFGRSDSGDLILRRATSNIPGENVEKTLLKMLKRCTAGVNACVWIYLHCTYLVLRLQTALSGTWRPRTDLQMSCVCCCERARHHQTERRRTRAGRRY
jgi:hypothetical protein